MRRGYLQLNQKFLIFPVNRHIRYVHGFFAPLGKNKQIAVLVHVQIRDHSRCIPFLLSTHTKRYSIILETSPASRCTFLEF